MATLDHIAGAEPSTVTFELRTVTFTQNSSKMHSEVLVLGDPDSTIALAAVLNAVPASTAWGLVVRKVGDSTTFIKGDSTVFQGSSAWQVQVTNQARVTNSSAADFQATVTQASSLWQVQVSNGNSSVTITAIAAGAGRLNIGSTAADNAVLVSGNSTVAPLAGSLWTMQGNSTVAPLAGSTWATRPIQSSAADLQMTATPVAGSTWNTRPIQSSAADLQMTATQTGTWTVNVGTHIQSSAAPSSNSSGIIVRQIVDNILTTASTSAFASTVMTIQSSGAALRSYVTAYSITTTNAGPSKISFYSSGVVLWPILLAAVSSAVSGVNLAVSAPAYLFRTIGAADALTLNLGGGASTIGGWRVGVSYFRAP